MAWHPFRNFGLKIAALGLGTLLWFTVSSQQLERSVRVPVEYRDVPASLELTGDQTDSVFVHFRGPDNVVSRFEPGDVRVVIDLSQATAVRQGVFPLRTDQVVAPAGAEVMWIEPHQVSLSIETVGTSTVPVVGNITGTPAAGYKVGSIKVDPGTVEVLGPAEQLRGLTAASTSPVSVEGATSTVTSKVNVEVPNAALRLRQAQKVTVTVSIDRGGGQ